jgi:ribose/xylose/arabinose/galactoside ABC-type transport system permease subunit
LAADLESAMTAFAKAASQAFLSSLEDSETLKQIALFCAAGLLVSVLLLTYGIDLSPGFF